MLKLRLILPVILIIISSNVFSQAHYGLKTALNLSNMKFEYSDSSSEPDSKINIGYVFGGVMEYDITKFFKIRPEIYLTSKGYSLDVEKIWGEGAKGYSRVNLAYIEIPVNLAFIFHGVEAFTAPYIAFGVNGKSKYEVTYQDKEYEDETKYKPVFGKVDKDFDQNKIPFNAFDYGFNFGLGYSSGPMIVDVIYSLGLGNIVPEIEGDDFASVDMKTSNRVILISVAFFYGK